MNESPHEKMHLYIEAAWGFSTVFGILLFMAEIAIICWVVFIKVSIKAALAGKQPFVIPSTISAHLDCVSSDDSVYSTNCYPFLVATLQLLSHIFVMAIYTHTYTLFDINNVEAPSQAQTKLSKPTPYQPI